MFESPADLAPDNAVSVQSVEKLVKWMDEFAQKQ